MKNLPQGKVTSHSEISPKEQLLPQSSSAGKASLSQSTLFPSNGLGTVITSATPRVPGFGSGQAGDAWTFGWLGQEFGMPLSILLVMYKEMWLQNCFKAGEIAQERRVLDALSEDRGLFPEPIWELLTTTCNFRSKDLIPSSELLRHPQAQAQPGMHASTHKTGRIETIE